MKNNRSFVPIVLFSLLFLYWVLHRIGIQIDVRMFLIFLIGALIVAEIIRLVVKHNVMDEFGEEECTSEPIDKTTIEYATSETKGEISDDETEKQKWFKKFKTDVKNTAILVFAVILIIGGKAAKRDVISDAIDPMLDRFDTSDEFFAEVEKLQQFREDWRTYREQERADGGPTYRAEDVFAETLKPDHWRNFLVFSSVPEGFYYKDRTINSRDPGDWTITQMYYDMDVEQDFFFYTQSRDKKYNKENLPEGVKKKEGQLFTEVDGNRNKVYWFYEDLTLYLEGNIPMEELEELANDAVNYDELYYDYSAIE